MAAFWVGLAVGLTVAGALGVLASRRIKHRARELQQRTRQSARLAYLGSLAGGLAHEIKNPLSTLNINLQLLEEDLEHKANQAVIHRRLEGLRQEVKRLQEVLDDFLRYARGHVLQLEETSVNELIDEVLDFVGPELQQKKIAVIRGYAEKLPRCRLDRNLIKQTFLNIIINAEQAMERGGDLMVRTALERDRVRVEFIDTGPGIGAENLPHIWDVYFSTKKGGTGLGLPTARRIIEEHDGAIVVHSEVGRGTCFTIRLPLTQLRTGLTTETES